MYEISDVIVLPQDEEILKRYRFASDSSVFEEVIDIAEMILEDEDDWQLQNQLDDAENFKMHGDKYNQRVYFILSPCRLLWDENKIRRAVKEIFTVHNTPTSCSDDDDVEAFISRMSKAVMTSADIDQVCSYLFDLYMAKVLYGDKILDKRLRITRMKIARGRKLDYDFNHKKINIVTPELKRSKDLIDLDPADSDGTLGVRTGSYSLAKDEAVKEEDWCTNDPDVKRWMNYSEDCGLSEGWKKILGF